MTRATGLPELRCRLEPAQGLTIVGETFSYVVINEGETPLMFGVDAALDWETDHRWQELPFGGWVAAVGLGVEPGERSPPQPVAVTAHLAPGRYRLTKKVSRGYMPQPDSIVVCCEFDIAEFRDE